MIKSFFFPSLLLFSCSAAHAAVITQWNFNGASTATVPGGTVSPTPSVGTGTAARIGSTSGSFVSGIAEGGSTDPVTTSPNNYAWHTSAYPTATASNLTAGVEFSVSTVGFESITFTYDLRHSNSSSRYEAVQYSVDGNAYSSPTYFTGAAGDTWFNGRILNLSAIPGANNNANFKVRIVSAFESSATGSGLDSYIGSGTTYAGGTWRFDMVTVNGTAIIPEPSAAMLGLLGAASLLRRRRA